MTQVASVEGQKSHPRFGAAAVELGFITADQLKQALMEQLDDDLQGRSHRVLGQILTDKGWIEPEQIPTILRVNLGPNFLR